MVKTKDHLLNDYQNNADQQQQQIAALKKRLNQIAFSRLGLFIAEILLIALMISQGFSSTIVVLMVLPVLLFMMLVRRQTAVQESLLYAEQLLWVYQNEISHLVQRKNNYPDGHQYEDEQHHYASDLDIYGQGSLYSYINRCHTRLGMDTLAANLGTPNQQQAISQRQEAVKELESHIAQTFHFRAALQSHQPDQLRIIRTKLLHQLPDQLKFTRKGLLRVYIRVVPFLMMGLLLLGYIYGGLTWRVFGLAALCNVMLTLSQLKHINQVYYGFTGSSSLLNAFSGTIKWTEDISWKSSYIIKLFGTNKNEQNVSVQIKQLAKIIQAFDARLNFLLAGFLNVFLLWDLRCSVNLANWHDQASEGVLQGLDRVGFFEELISLATLSYNEPEWTWPVIASQFRCQAVSLGHPLIPEDKRVANDFNLQHSPTVDVVTGSNMAGKSTFLRTLGINMVLAFAGAPVCASEMSVSIFRLLSYMRIKDSLNDQTSTFKAELNRLKMILDAILVEPDSLVLIDEMLRGTNSKDKYLGSKVFIEKLMEQHTPALFATHDLQLSEMKADHPEQLRNYHFDIQIAEGEMKFDYKLKHGPCTTFNAALLLKEIGLTLSS